jgi:type II secretory ATPase GspE/PulE/Tfp pilus assembly ATPase PilB-like protein
MQAESPHDAHTLNLFHFQSRQVMPDTDLNTPQAPSTVPEFIWPSPPYFELPSSDRTTTPELCVIDLAKGTQLAGRMVRLLPDEAMVEIQTAHAPEIQSIGFAEFQRLTLSQPVLIRKQEGLPGAQAGVQLPDANRQSFVIDYNNGDTFVGETAGFASETYGLFLFLQETEGTVLRCFVPQAAIRDFRIGELIGTILVKQKIASPEQVEAALQEQRKLRAQRLGELLTDKQLVSPEELSAAIQHTTARPILRLGEALLELGLLTEEELKSALAQQKLQRKKPLGELLIGMGVVDRDTVRKVMAHKLGIPFVNLREFKMTRDVLPLVPASIVWRYRILPIFKNEKQLVIAVSDPTSMPFVSELRFMTGLQVIPVIAEEDALQESIRQCYGESTEPVVQAEAMERPTDKPDELAFYHSAADEANADELLAKLEAEGTEIEVADAAVSESDNTLVKFVNKMILDAHAQLASDIHVETYPGKKNIRIRFRKDGIMVEYMELPPKFRNAILSRIKIMAQLDISDRRKPQDGRIDFKRFGPARIELRAATIPTANGLEDVVMRILAAVKPVPIDRLGLEPKSLAELKQMLIKPHGLILICGPTGSGKTTTLHSALSYINTPERKIWTAEDPIEITQQGLRQVQVNPKIGWTFAGALRSFLRLDPDVIMVGEMRDEETAKIGLEASLTGHLVLSTLHTNSAVESVVRLLDMGADPFQFADALLGVLAQRLARRLCSQCRESYAPSSEELAALAQEYSLGTPLDADAVLRKWSSDFAATGRQAVLYTAKGCQACGQTGYKGRLGIHELFVAHPAIKRMIQSKAFASDILDAAVAAGMLTLKQNGIEKVLRGETDMQQVRAVCA